MEIILWYLNCRGVYLHRLVDQQALHLWPVGYICVVNVFVFYGYLYKYVAHVCSSFSP